MEMPAPKSAALSKAASLGVVPGSEGTSSDDAGAPPIQVLDDAEGSVTAQALQSQAIVAQDSGTVTIDPPTMLQQMQVAMQAQMHAQLQSTLKAQQEQLQATLQVQLEKKPGYDASAS